MADLPITFSGPMVRALLREIERPGTGKTQTRRVLNQPSPPDDADRVFTWFPPAHVPIKGIPNQWAPGGLWADQDRYGEPSETGYRGGYKRHVGFLRYRPGDRLYVREHWRAAGWLDAVAPRDLARSVPFRYEADPVDTDNLPLADGRFRQAMHMPKWASRITLIVTEVRVERLQDCSEADAIAEGIAKNPVQQNGSWMVYPEGSSAAGFIHPADSYRTLWDSIHGTGAWAGNPWVVAYTFRPVLGNVSTLPEGGAV